ncbi:diguanylate cyclase domain-containing protein [Solibacillus daqui]|uniref:diguanylate cyclase domain-containing protein n=1 Tax=Solibacillus daqui TaxID=2912187 RepID=UPI003B75C013
MENFKQINDIYGHTEGKILLSKVMKKLIKMGARKIMLYVSVGDKVAVVFERRRIQS